MAIHTLKENNGKGVDHLALLKADVDFLGLIFSMGIDDLSISRYATLARMLNLFFTGWLKDEIKQRFDRIYTVYSGGDDLLLIGPWEMIIEFAKSLNDNFNAFAGGNPNITLSAGIALSKPNSPIGTLSKVAEENLSNSKNTGRDKLTVFETTVNWQIIEDLVEFKDFLNNQLRQENIKSAFLYRLLKYHEMFLEAEEGRIEGLRFHSLMVRDIKRNIEKKDNQGNVINQEVIDRLLPLCAIIDQDRELMINIKIPVFWTLYKNRGG
jgi:CRISPR-associated protein Csm1